MADVVMPMTRVHHDMYVMSIISMTKASCEENIRLASLSSSHPTQLVDRKEACPS